MAMYLTVFGFIWLLIGNVIGLVLARRRESHVDEIERLSSVDSLLEFHERDWNYRWNKTCHAHSSLFSLVCVMVGIALHTFNTPPSTLMNLIVIGLSSSVVLWTVSSFRQIKPIMAGADVLFIGSIAATIYVLLTSGAT